MTIVSYSKCKKCGKTLNVTELAANPDGIGSICKEKNTCNKKEPDKNSEAINESE